MLRELKNLTSLIVFGFLLLNLSCGKDCPTCPTCPEDPEHGSYYVYISDLSQTGAGYIWVANSKTDSIIDSIPVPNAYIKVMDISPNKQFLTANTSDGALIIDLDSNKTIHTLNSGFPFFSYDGSYLLIGDINLDRLYKISTLDWSIVDSDTMPFTPSGVFNNSPVLFGSNPGEYFLYNYETMAIIKKDSIMRTDGRLLSLWNAITSPDDRYLYFSHTPNNLYKYEIETDSIVDSLYVIWAAYLGQFRNSLDGKSLLFTEVSDWWNPNDYPIGNLLIIDPNSFTIDRRITTWNLNPEFPAANIAVEKFDITPDGYKVISGTQASALTPVSFDLLDFRASIVSGLIRQASPCDVAIGRQIE